MTVQSSGEPRDYRNQIARALREQLDGYAIPWSWHFPEEGWTALADEVLKVRDAEMAALVAEGQAVATANQTLRNENRDLDAEMEQLRAAYRRDMQRDANTQTSLRAELAEAQMGYTDAVRELDDEVMPTIYRKPLSKDDQAIQAITTRAPAGPEFRARYEDEGDES